MQANQFCDNCKSQHQVKEFKQDCNHLICKDCIRDIVSSLKIERQIHKNQRIPINQFKCPVQTCQCITLLDRINYEVSQRIWSEGQMCVSTLTIVEEEEPEQVLQSEII